MKASILFFAFLFSITSIIAQEKQDKFVLNGDVIEATLYHDNGAVSQTGFYNKEGKLQGEWISYNSDGEKTAVAKYDNGEKVDTWLFYHGNVIKEVTYNDSKISKIKTWKVTDVSIVTNG